MMAHYEELDLRGVFTTTEGKPVSELFVLRDQVHQTAVEKGWWEPQQIWARIDSPDGTERSYGHALAQRTFGDLMALVHSEVSEALEEYRAGHAPDETYYVHADGTRCEAQPCEAAGKPEGVPVELADIIIRVLDIAGFYGIDMDAALQAKMKYNRTRPTRHGGKTL